VSDLYFHGPGGLAHMILMAFYSIVFDDADVEKAAESATAVKFRCSGQVCIAANRLLVQAGIHDRFVEALKARVKSFRVGYGLGIDKSILYAFHFG
jgi:acyl-CoA reductase-like NAD-dependent aldehyde dehydrogenase